MPQIKHLIAAARATKAMHFGAGGKFLRGHGIRSRPPKQMPPNAIISGYANEIKRRVVGVIRSALKPLFDALPHLVAGHAAERDVRRDAAEAQEAMQLFADAERAVQDQIGPVLMREMARRAADEAGRMQANQLSRQLKALVGVDVHARAKAEDSIVDTFVNENVALIGGISKRTLDKIARMTVRGLADWTSASELSAKLQKQLGFADDRADMIARDQLSKLNGQLNHARQQELGINRFIWRHNGKSKDPREDHLARDGQVFNYDDFEPDELPGQPCNCECVSDPLVDVAGIFKSRNSDD